MSGERTTPGSNRAHDKHGNLLGWLVFTDESKTIVQLIDRLGRKLTVHKEADGTVWMETQDGHRVDPRPVQPDDPFELVIDVEGNVVVLVDGRGDRIA